jgi:putative PIG3 family NAD(P)H quinone oxidoreductase
MRAVVIADDKSVSVGQADKPEPRAGEVLIKVAYAGINRADLLQRRGNYPVPPGASPILGMEVSGVIERGGARFKPGDEVCALLAGGGYAEYVTAPEGSVLPLPKGVSLEQGAALPEATFTVWANVFEPGALKTGEVFLCHGGASGIGVFAIQMAKAHGATVFATAGDDEKCALVERLGAKAINYRKQDFEAVLKEAGGADVILDMVGGDYVQKNINILRLNGRCVNIAYMQGAKVTVDFMVAMRKNAILAGSTLRPRPVEEKARLAREVERVVWPWVETGKVKLIVDSVFALDDVEAAMARMNANLNAGKILLKV